MIIPVVCLSQTNSGTIEVSDYKTIDIIKTSSSQSIKLINIEKQPVNGSWSQLNNFLGIANPSCSNTDSGNNCYFQLSGIEIYFSDRLGDFTMGKLSIDSPDFAMKINGIIIKVGDNVSKIASVQQDAYSKRHSIDTGDGIVHQVLIRLKYVDTVISFEYNSSTNKITLITVFNPL